MSDRPTTGDELASPAGLASLSAGAMLAGFASGQFTPVDVIDELIPALEAADERCTIFVTPMYQQARSAAEAAARQWAAGEPEALCGVPVSVKDLLFIKGLPAFGGAPTQRGFVPEVSSAVVTRLEHAGAVITGKTTTCESGYKLTADSPVSGITRNPWNPARTSGGSSGGAAAGLAAGAGPLAIGTDAVGSIRVPASFCGVCGLKPTFGLVPRPPGFFPPSWGSLAHTGPMARHVSDLALLLTVIAGFDERDAVSLPQPPRSFDTAAGRLDGVRLGFSADLGFAPLAPDVRTAFERAIGILEGLGCAISEDHPEVRPDSLETILKPIGYTEQATAVGDRSAADLDLSEPEFRAIVAQGRGYSGVDYMNATHERARLRSRCIGMFERVDVLITPTVATTAFAAGTLGVDEIDGQSVDRHLGWSPFSWPINLVGLPAASIPCGFDAAGLPIGLQIIAPWLREDLILEIAAAFEAARGDMPLIAPAA